MAWERTWTVIMAGGVGSRFWPLSRADRPKQLRALFGDRSMLRASFDRLAARVPPERQLVVTGQRLEQAVRDELPELPDGNVLAEPAVRNTAPAIGWAAHEIRRRDPDGLLAALPADHWIGDDEGFRRDAGRALEAAAEGRIVTLGIEPNRPETGYGYIRAGAALGEHVREATAFREKPDPETAARYLAEGGWYWNAGMFFMGAGDVLDELARWEPQLADGLSGLAAGDEPPTREWLAEVYEALPSISIDYAVAERSERIAVVPGRFGWSDVGSWRTLWDFRPEGEASYRLGDTIEIDGEGNVIVGEGGVAAAVGVRDLVVVHTPDATLVCPRDSAQRVREVVARLRDDEREELL